MKELFPNITEQFRQNVDFIFDVAMAQKSPEESARVLIKFLETCYNQEAHDYTELTFQIKLMERLNNENNSNQRAQRER